MPMVLSCSLWIEAVALCHGAASSPAYLPAPGVIVISKTIHLLTLLALHFACGVRTSAPRGYLEGIIYVQLLGAIAPSRHHSNNNQTHTHLHPHPHPPMQVLS